MLKDCNALRTVTDLLTEHLQTNFSQIDAIVGKLKPLYCSSAKPIIALMCIYTSLQSRTVNTYWLVPTVAEQVILFLRISLFPKGKLRETLRFEGNKMNCFLRDQSSSGLSYRWKFWSWKVIKPRLNGSCQPTFMFNSALLPSDVVDFAILPAQRFCKEITKTIIVKYGFNTFSLQRTDLGHTVNQL